MHDVGAAARAAWRPSTPAGSPRSIVTERLPRFDAQVVRRLAVAERRAPGARRIARPGPLDLDDVRAEVGEDHRAVRTREDAREIEHAHAGERRGGRSCRRAPPGPPGVVSSGLTSYDARSEAAVGADDERAAQDAHVRRSGARARRRSARPSRGPSSTSSGNGSPYLSRKRGATRSRRARCRRARRRSPRIVAVAVAQRAGLGRTARRVVLGVEVEDDRAPAQRGERHRVALVALEREVGCLVTGLQHALLLGTERVRAPAGDAPWPAIGRAPIVYGRAGSPHGRRWPLRRHQRRRGHLGPADLAARAARVTPLLSQLLALSHTLALLQGAFGLYLLAGGYRAPMQLHYVYGLLPSAAVLFGYSARTADGRRNLLQFSIIALRHRRTRHARLHDREGHVTLRDPLWPQPRHRRRSSRRVPDGRGPGRAARSRASSS